MNRNTLNKLVNFVWFQSIWVLAIFTQYQFWWALAVLLVVFFLMTSQPRLDAVCMLLVVALGTLVDSALTLTGMFAFSGPVYGVPIPLWLVALWAGFSLTLGHSLNYLQGRPGISALLGVIFGPLSYWAGARFGAVDFPNSLIFTLIILAVVWGLLFPLCMYVYKICQTRLSPKQVSN
ncbi:DUF2878 domain-containing protein [Salinimonas marina]|uniref:DUF2878 domain-containing protein n=1 Tax=Salinimonas marina TaxID=2785918 RepID=A0A7S9DV23_9ALTE|nr:DUF2878 domain-containing protein [Salinimonas marina]QPG04380.1 DUF2878 domain-containing protein [Salinimonas marina]